MFVHLKIVAAKLFHGLLSPSLPVIFMEGFILKLDIQIW